MIIDFHTHAYPPFLAKKAVAQVQKNFGIVPRGDGTPEGLRVSMKNAGFDVKSPDHIHCTPDMALEVIREVRPEKLVLAHMGGVNLWQEVEEKALIFYKNGCRLLNIKEQGGR